MTVDYVGRRGSLGKIEYLKYYKIRVKKMVLEMFLCPLGFAVTKYLPYGATSYTLGYQTHLT